MPIRDLEQRFPTFFQAYWLKPMPAERTRQMKFGGGAPAFSAVIREVTNGRPLSCYRVNLVGGTVTLDLTQSMIQGQIVLDLFGDQADADRYFQESAGGWTADEIAILRNPVYLNMIPDVSFTPQNLIRSARHACDPRDPQSVALMNAELLVNYRRFSQFDGNVLPEVTRPGIRGVWVAAPGNPPEWIPPD